MIPGRIRPTTDHPATLPHCEISPYLACRALLDRDLVSLLCHRRRVLPDGNRGNDFIHSLCRGILRILPAAGPPGGLRPRLWKYDYLPYLFLPVIGMTVDRLNYDYDYVMFRYSILSICFWLSWSALWVLADFLFGRRRYIRAFCPGGGVSPGPGGAVLQL